MQSYVVHFLRHAMTEANKSGQFAGSWDVPLCDEGKENLKNLKKHFEYPFAKEYYSSPMKRCIETCEIIYPEAKIQVVGDLRECAFGEWEKKTSDEIGISDKNLNPDKGESWQDLHRRVTAAFEKIVESMMRRGVTSAVIVTHGGVIMTLLAQYGFPRAELFEWMVYNGCGYSVRITPGLWMREKVFEVYDKVPRGADVALSGKFKDLIENLKEKENEK